MGPAADRRAQQAAELRRKLIAKRWDRAEARDRQREIEAHYIVEVSQATDDAGKRAYPNERARRAAVTLKLAADDEYTSLRHRMRVLDAETHELAFELGSLARFGEPFGFLDRGL